MCGVSLYGGLQILIFATAGLQIQPNEANPAEQGYFLLLKTESNRKRICFFLKCLYISAEKIQLWKIKSYYRA